MPNFETIQDVLMHLIDPWLFMALSASHIPMTISSLFAARQWYLLFTPWGFKEALFGNFWATVGPQIRENAGPNRVVPLLEGKVRDGVVTDKVVATPISGRVIEVGAGTGMWADVFSEIGGGGAAVAAAKDENKSLTKRGEKGSKPGPSQLTKVYGVEPNPQSAEALRERVKEVGLGDIYEVIPVGIESLSDPEAWSGTTIEPGSIDCIVSILCLCSIPDQAKNIQELYRLLKPGGRWYVYEHVKAERGGILLRAYQRTFLCSCLRTIFPPHTNVRVCKGYVNVFWSFFLGSCRLCQPTKTNLELAGPWSKIDLNQPPDEPSYKLLPHIIGTLTK